MPPGHNTSNPPGMASEEFDVVIIGAGISGISAAYHLSTLCPGRSFAMLEQREDLGGTWDLFRYPGVRSDSDMHTLGFRFFPWVREESIAEGDAILEYLNEAVDRFDIRRRIRFGQKVTSAEWSSEAARWTLTVETAGDQRTVTCSVLFACAGYYSYTSGHTPEFPGIDGFAGSVVHPQFWPDDLDVTNANVAVIGSGATAVTIVPALAKTAKHVTMLQRSATYMVSSPNTDSFAIRLREWLPDRFAYSITRARNISRDQLVYLLSRRAPEVLRKELLRRMREHVGDEMTAQHFTPTYAPWDQRLCLVPNSDFFDAVNSDRASVVTDTIDRITHSGVQLASGDHIDADVVVTATGLTLALVGGIEVSVDGRAVDFADTVSYRGAGYSGVPNLFSTFGYVNASWTLRADMVSRYVCRVLNEMSKAGVTTCTPTLREVDIGAPRSGWVDDFSAGYLQRMLPNLPAQLDHDPWRNHQNFLRDQKSLLYSPIDDGVLLLR